MADVAVDRLIVDIEARTRQFETQLKKLEGTVSGSSQRMSRNFNTLNSSIASAGKTLVGAFGVTLGVGLLAQLPGLMAKSIEELGSMTDAADKAGVSIAKLQQLTFAGIGTGTGQSEIVSMMEMFNKRIGEAATKGGDLADLFRANGISLRDNNGQIRNNVELLTQVADLVRNARSEQEATVVATIALGKSGAELLPFLKQGGDGMRALMQAAIDAGYVIDTGLVKKADEFADRWNIAWDSFVKRGQGALGEMLAQFQNFGRMMSGDVMTKGSIFSQKSGDIEFETETQKFVRMIDERKKALADLAEQQKYFAPVKDPETEQRIADINAEIAALEKRKRLLPPIPRDDRGGLFNSGLGNRGVNPTVVPDQVAAVAAAAAEKERLAEEKRLAAARARAEELIKQKYATNALTAEQELLNQAIEKQADATQRVQEVFTTVFGDLESAIDNFVDTGKFKFKDMVESMLKDLIKLQVHNGLAGLDKLMFPAVSQAPSQDSGVGGLSGILAKLFNFGAAPSVYADGGAIGGKGSGRSDSNLVRVSRGEFIVNAKAAGENMGLLKRINDGGAVHSVAVPRFANGGMVEPRSASPDYGRGGGGGTKVNIITAPGLPVSRKKNMSGGLDVMVGDFMESKFGAMFDKQAPRYGLRPQMTART